MAARKLKKIDTWKVQTERGELSIVVRLGGTTHEPQFIAECDNPKLYMFGKDLGKLHRDATAELKELCAQVWERKIYLKVAFHDNDRETNTAGKTHTGAACRSGCHRFLECVR